EVEETCQKAYDQARGVHEKHTAQAQKRHDRDLQLASERLQEKKNSFQERRDADWKKAQEKHDKDVADSTQRREADLRQAHDKYQKLRAEIYSLYETDSAKIHEHHYKLMTESRLRQEKEWTALTSKWHQGLARAQTLVQQTNRESSRLFPDWSAPTWKDWLPPAAVPPAI